ncbi:MAG: hypothetical protein R3B99_07630 [Polyangiales bacterium]
MDVVVMVCAGRVRDRAVPAVDQAPFAARDVLFVQRSEDADDVGEAEGAERIAGSSVQ